MPPAPILFFLPAHDEVAAVSGVVGSIPSEVAGHPVRALVVDDGSRDGTAEAARASGAAVDSFAANRGLGAAVRHGLARGVAEGAVAVAFCDADGEYDPRQLPALLAPILEGRADYVVGSRFAGGPRRMRLHRSLGNRMLTLAVRALSGQPVTDGQSGFRVLSGPAAAAAEVAHDYNYAQVLTLDLVAKGFRYAEVPISYRFRTSGRSFVRLVPYLAAVIPAMGRAWRSGRRRGIRGGQSPPCVLVLDHEAPEGLPRHRPGGRVEASV